MTAIQRWTKGLVSAFFVAVGVGLGVMLLAHFEGLSLWPPSKRFLAFLCVVGFFNFTGYLAGAKAERKAAAATFDGGAIHVE